MKNSPFRTIAISLLPLMFVVLGCSRLAGLRTNYLEGGNAAKAIAEVQSKVGKPFRVIEVMIEKDEVRVQLVAPDNPRNVDEYRARAGFVAGPNPVKLNALIGDPMKSSVPMEEIDFAAIPKMITDALEKTALEGGAVRRMTFQRGFALSGSTAGSLGAPRWNIEIEGTRESASATANGAGEIIGLDLSRTARGKDYSVLSKEELKRAQDALRSIVGSGNRVQSITIRKDTVSIEALTSGESNDMESFTFGIGGVKKGLVSGKAIQSKTEAFFALADIDLTAALDYIEKTRSRLEMPGAEITSVTFRRTVKTVMNLDEKTNQISVSLRQSKNEGTVTFDLTDGSEQFANKNGKSLEKR